MPIKTQVSLACFFLLCLSFQLYIQINGITLHDVLWSFEVGKRLSLGKTYFNDYFETNPPLLYYLHASLFYLSQTLQLKMITVFCAFITLCEILSLFCINKILSELFKLELRTRTFCLIVQILLLTFVLNVNYGQKEMLMIVMSFPYFWLTTLRAQNKLLSQPLVIFISALAGIGFAFKPPYFYIPVILSELYLIYSQKKLSVVFRKEPWIILSIFVIYLTVSYQLSPDYFTKILPTIIKSYTAQSFLPFSETINKIPVICFVLLFPFWLWVRSFQTENIPSLRPTMDLWLIVSFGFLLSFILQNKGWYYQAAPLVAANFILFCLLALQACRHLNVNGLERGASLITPTIVGIFFFVQPSINTIQMKLNNRGTQRSDFLRSVENISQLSPQKDFYMFSTLMDASYFIHYGHLKLKSRFASLWTLPAIYNENNPHRAELKQELYQYIIEDFERHKPSMVLIEDPYYISDPNFSYINFIQENPKLKSIWQHYDFKETVQLESKEKTGRVDVYLLNTNQTQS